MRLIHEPTLLVRPIESGPSNSQLMRTSPEDRASHTDRLLGHHIGRVRVRTAGFESVIYFVIDIVCSLLCRVLSRRGV